jgi:NAD(P)-dependent dehydrogenase (short-subunit alcohol dehydrogenase family)
VALEDQVIIVNGGASGIGLEASRALAHKDANLNAGIGLVKPSLEMDPVCYHRLIEVDQHSVYCGAAGVLEESAAGGVPTFAQAASSSRVG